MQNLQKILEGRGAIAAVQPLPLWVEEACSLTVDLQVPLRLALEGVLHL